MISDKSGQYLVKLAGNAIRQYLETGEKKIVVLTDE